MGGADERQKIRNVVKFSRIDVPIVSKIYIENQTEASNSDQRNWGKFHEPREFLANADTAPQIVLYVYVCPHWRDIVRHRNLPNILWP